MKHSIIAASTMLAAGVACIGMLPIGAYALSDSSSASFVFSRDLTIGSRGPDVLALQQFLNTHSAVIAQAGIGSPGQETDYFGALTSTALGVFQKTNGIVPSAGYFGPRTRSFISAFKDAGIPASDSTVVTPTSAPAGGEESSPEGVADQISVQVQSAAPQTAGASTSPLRPPFKIFASVPPPVSDSDTRYADYYLTDAFTVQALKLTATSSSATIGKYYFLWANRCALNGAAQSPSYDGCPSVTKKSRTGNFLFYPSHRTEEGTNTFSSLRRADNCTLAQAAYMLGMKPSAISAQWGAGLTIVWDPANAPGGMFSDTCVMPQTQAPTIDGIIIDYEVQDDRTPAQTTDFLTRFSNLLHSFGKKAVLYSNSLGAMGSKTSGIDSTNAYTLSQQFDLMSILLWSGNTYSGSGNILASFNDQLAVIRGSANNPVDFKKIAITFELGKTTLSDATTVRSLALTKNIPAIILWRNGAVVSATSSAGVQIKCMALGDCGGNTVPSSIKFSAAQEKVASGSATTLTWSSSGVQSCTLNGPGIAETSLSGSRSTGPLRETASFVLTCTTSAGVEYRTVTVHVGSAQNPPYTSTVTSGVAYGPLPSQVLNVCQPKDTSVLKDNAPAAVIFHAGGWINGDAASANGLCNVLAQRGIVAVTINYRLSATSTGAQQSANVFPAQIEDAQLAMRWLRQNAGTYHINPARVCAVGSSAGSYLAEMLGILKDIYPGDMAGQLTSQRSDADCVVSYSSIMDLTQSEIVQYVEALFGIPYKTPWPQIPAAQQQAIRDASPLFIAKSNTAATFFLQGADDVLAPPAKQAIPLYLSLLQKGVLTKLIIRSGGHSLPTDDYPSEVAGYYDQTAAFIFEQTAKAPAPTPTPTPTPSPNSKLEVRVDPTFTASVVSAGTTAEVGRFILDASQSQENIIATSTSFFLRKDTTIDTISCLAYANGVVLNEKLPLVTKGGGHRSFVFDSPLTIKKGATQAISIRCSIRAGSFGGIQWGIVPLAKQARFTIEGAVSHALIVPGAIGSDGVLVTVRTPSFDDSNR